MESVKDIVGLFVVVCATTIANSAFGLSDEAMLIGTVTAAGSYIINIR